MRPELRKVIYARLTGTGGAGVGDRVYMMQAPDAAALPYAVISPVVLGKTNQQPRDAIREMWQIDCWGSSWAAAETVYQAVVASMAASKLTIAGWSVWWQELMDTRTFVENVAGKQYFRYMAEFDIRASKN